MINASVIPTLTLARLARGEEAAFVEVFEVHKDGVYEIAMRYTQSEVLSEEIVQDVFTSVWLKREELTEKDNLSAWLFTITRNRSFKVLRGLARRKVHETGMISHIPDAFNDPQTDANEKLETAELQGWISQALAKLTKEQRRAFELIKEQGMSRDEAAIAMGLSPNTVKVHLLHATRTIRGHLIAKGVVVPAVLALFPVFL